MVTYKFSAIETQIYKIGCKMVSCKNSCLGIALNLRKGIIPRCLIFETDGRKQNRGSVVVGINPGRSRADEQNFYVSTGQTYEQVVAYWKKQINKRRYYKWLEDLINQMDFSGPILWTELVKCESAVGGKIPPLQTFRICTKTYLSEELKSIPTNWPLIAVGREAYKALAYRYPNHIVVGVPHPTGSYGQFSKLFNKNKQLLSVLKPKFNELWDGKNGKAIWLDTRK